MATAAPSLPSTRSPKTNGAAQKGGPATASVPHHRVVILGTGFGGVGMAIRLLQAGERDFVVLERADEVGGTWRDNTYPGCQCDVGSTLYSFSFAPNPDWSRAFAWQGEIFDYLRKCTDRYGVRPYVRFGHELLEAHFIEAQQRWRIRTNRGELTADFVVSGHGGLSAPSVPEIPGLSRFRGTVFHSAAWNHEHALQGERVAVVGTGASAIQVVPAVQPKAKHLTLFQRTPAWVVPRIDPEYSRVQKWLFRALPFVQKLDRLRQYLFRELVVIGLRNPQYMRRYQRVVAKHIADQVKNPELAKKLTPNYALGCKRILLSNDYYPALAQKNVEVVTNGIREVDETGVIDNAGVHHEVDTVILCTGFKVTNHPVMQRYFGRDGRSLAEHWEQGASAYLGTTVTGFPNLFLLTGPYTGLGHNSVIYMLESQFNYVMDALRVMDAQKAGAFEVRPEVADAFDAEMQDALKGTVWNAGGCASWYLDAKGRNTTLWPTHTWAYRKRTRRFDVAAYQLQPRTVVSAEHHAHAAE